MLHWLQETNESECEKKNDLLLDDQHTCDPILSNIIDNP